MKTILWFLLCATSALGVFSTLRVTVPPPTAPIAAAPTPEASTSESAESEEAAEDLDLPPGAPSLTRTLADLRAIESMSVEALQTALREAVEQGDEARLRLLVAAWARQDPASAFQFLLTCEDSNVLHLPWNVVFREWARRDARAALEASHRLPDEDSRRAMAQSIFAVLAEQDPSAAFALAFSVDPTLRHNTLSPVLNAWAKTDPDSAWQAMQSLPPDQRRRLFGSYFLGRFSTDREGAIEQAIGLGNGEEGQMAFGVLSLVLLDEGPTSLFQVLDERVPPEMRANFAQVALWEAMERAPQEALHWVSTNLTGRDRERAVAHAIDFLSQHSPQDAASYISALPYGATYAGAVEALSENWGRQSPAEALAWVETLPPGKERSDAFRRVVEQLALKDPEAALQFAAGADAEERSTVIEAVAQAKAKSDPQDALVWLETVESGMRDDARASLIKAWAANDPVTAADYVSRHLSQLPPELGVAVADAWSRKNAAAAAAWAISLGDDEARARAVNRVTGEWLRQDSFAASAWIESLPSGKAREEAVENVVERIHGADPAAAFAWATTMEESDRRRNWTNLVVRGWKETDPAAAAAAIRGSGLPEEEQARLLEGFDE